jgi:hypothetical protein
MNQNVKIVLTVALDIVVLASAVALGTAIYTHTKVGTDKKAMFTALGVGIVSGFVLTKYLKK